MEREEIGDNGVSLTGHAVNFECPDCGAIKRFVTSAFVTTHYCDECGDLRWFEFKWELNR